MSGRLTWLGKGTILNYFPTTKLPGSETTCHLSRRKRQAEIGGDCITNEAFSLWLGLQSFDGIVHRKVAWDADKEREMIGK